MFTVRYTDKNGTIGFIETGYFTIRDTSDMSKEYKKMGFTELSNFYSERQSYEITFPKEGLVIEVKSFNVAINGKNSDEIFKRG